VRRDLRGGVNGFVRSWKLTAAYLEGYPAAKAAIITGKIAAQRGGAIKVAQDVHSQTGFWESAILSACEPMQHRFVASSIQLENCSAPERGAQQLTGTVAPEFGSAVKIAGCIVDQGRERAASVSASHEVVKHGQDAHRVELEYGSILGKSSASTGGAIEIPTLVTDYTAERNNPVGLSGKEGVQDCLNTWVSTLNTVPQPGP